MAQTATAPRFTKRDYARIFKEGHEAGMAAGKAKDAAKFVAVERQNPLDDTSPVKKVYAQPFEACGFAWVNVRPGTSGFARWLVAKGHAHKAYYGGIDVWVRHFGQGMERKEAYAQAMAEVFRSYGFKAYAGSRMD